jgi:hypothetical protein
MNDVLKAILMLVGAIVLCLALIFGLNLFGLANYSFFAPKVRAVDAQVFKQSEQYNDGMVRDLENLQIQYMQANADQKAALKDIILHRFAVYDVNKLPPNLFAFYSDLRSGKL